MLSEVFPGAPDKGGALNKSFAFNSFEDGEREKLGWGGPGDISLFASDLELDQEQDNSMEKYSSEPRYGQELLPLGSFGSMEDMYDDVVSPPFQLCQEEIRKLVTSESVSLEINKPPKKERLLSFPTESLKILKNYGSRLRKTNAEETDTARCGREPTEISRLRLSTNQIIQLAGENFVHGSYLINHDLSTLGHPYARSFLGLSDEDTKKVELIEHLLASAEKVGEEQFDRATKLLDECDKLSSAYGSPVERLVYYFSKALREKIELASGRYTSNGLGKKQFVNINDVVLTPNPTVIAFHQETPFSQVPQFVGIQALVEQVAEASKVHVIDLEIRCGLQCTILMQALSARQEHPLEYLKITAVGTRSKQTIEETGRRLKSFAMSLNLQFCFNIVMVADIRDLKEDLFDLETDEAVAIYSPYILKSMIPQPERLESLMKVIRTINPCVMVVIETEAGLNSPVFVNRFTEALFFFGAFFDSMEDCMKHDELNRRISESIYFGQSIRNIVAAEGEERIMRSVNIRVWRAFFARFGMKEIEPSMSSKYQANLVLKSFSCGSSCTLDMDEKSLLIGWKGTPINSLSAWKFY